MYLRLLIVEDHLTVRESLQFVFAAAGISRCEVASTCAEAIQIVRRESLDLVLLDLVLPDGNGFDVLREIKAVHPLLPVLVHSCRDEVEILAHSFHVGASGYLVKGDDKNHLLEAVRQTSQGVAVWTAEQMASIREAEAGCR